MIDIETMGTKSNAVIASIGAVPFNKDSWKYSKTKGFYVVVDIQSCLDVGLKIEGPTLYWWLRQSNEARTELLGSQENPKISISHALKLFTDCVHSFKSPEMWGNSAAFDLGRLTDAYNKLNKDIPWKYGNERDVRTLVKLKPELRSKTKRTGTHHHPIDDAVHQIRYCSKIWKSINKK